MLAVTRAGGIINAIIMLKFFKRKQESLKRADLVVLVAGLAVFVAVVFHNISKSSIWFDEAFGAYLIRFNFWDIAVYTANDVHPPLYYWLLQAWTTLFGTNELGFRSMSVFFAVIAIVFAFLLARKWFGQRVAWISLALMIFTPFFIRYAQEARMYTMVAAIAFAATYVMIRALESKQRRLWILYGVLVGLGMLTHYFAALVWLAHWLWRFASLKLDKVKSKKILSAFFSKDWIIAHVVAVGVFAVWIPAFFYQLFNVQGNGFWIPPVTPGTLPNFMTNVLYYLELVDVQSWFALVFIAVLIALVVLVVRVFNTLKTEQKKQYLLILFLAIIPPLILLILSMPPLRPSFVDRYVVPSSLAIVLLIGVTLGLGRRLVSKRHWQLGMVVIFAVLLYGISNVYRLGNYNNTLHTANGSRQIVEAIDAKAASGEPIIADSPWLYYETAFYSTPNHSVYFINANTEYRYGSLEMLRLNDIGKIKDLTAFTKEHDIVWYVGRPGDRNLTAPAEGWKKLQEVRVSDSYTSKKAYQAIQYLVP